MNQSGMMMGVAGGKTSPDSDTPSKRLNRGMYDPEYEEKRARNNEAVRKCRSKKRQAQEEKEKRLTYMERGE